MATIQKQAFGFNTQPPEGGWAIVEILKDGKKSFNTQPPEGGWLLTHKTLFYIA